MFNMDDKIYKSYAQQIIREMNIDKCRELLHVEFSIPNSS